MTSEGHYRAASAAAAAGGVGGGSGAVPLLHRDAVDGLVGAGGGTSGERGGGGRAAADSSFGSTATSSLQVPLMHPRDVSSLVRSATAGGRGTGGRHGSGTRSSFSSRTRCGGRGGRGTLRPRRQQQQQQQRADCLVEVRQPPTTMHHPQQQRQSQPSPMAGTPSPGWRAEGTHAASTPREGMDGRDPPLEVAVIPNPGGEGGGAPLRVTVGRVSALAGEESMASVGGVGDEPVIVLEVSVVGTERVGPGITGEFACALRRKLLSA